MKERKYYRYIPIYKKSEIPEIKNVGACEYLSEQRHVKREKDALTEALCKIALNCDSKSVKEVFLEYDIKLIEDEKDGARVISASFPSKRFY
jgi:hypothetical protein